MTEKSANFPGGLTPRLEGEIIITNKSDWPVTVTLPATETIRTWQRFDYEDQATYPTVAGTYAIMISGDSEYLEGHVIYSYPDYQCFANYTPIDGHGQEARFECDHDEEVEQIMAWYGPITIPKYEG